MTGRADAVRAAAALLLTPDDNGSRRDVYAACEGKVKIYKFDRVLQALAATEVSK